MENPESLSHAELMEKCSLRIIDGAIVGIIETGQKIALSRGSDDPASEEYGMYGFLDNETLGEEEAEAYFKKYEPIARAQALSKDK